MTDETVQKEAQRLTKALPMYLAAQAITLLFTALDIPLYMDVYRANHFFAVDGWMGAWFVLVIFGLANAVFLLVRRSWQVLFDEKARAKLALGYSLGGIAGLLTLGIRFFPIIPPQYFAWVGGVALLSLGAYFVWNKRVHRVEELFP